MIFLQYVITGIAIGSIYALIAQGYYVTQVTSGMINFGQGDLTMLAALVGFSLYVGMGLPLWLTLLIAALLMALLGLLIHRVAIAPLRNSLSISWVLSTLAFALVVQNAAMLIWGRNIIQVPSPFGNEPIRIGSLGIYPQEIFIVVASAATMLLLYLFLQRTILGKALRAVAFNKDAAALMGIKVQRMVLLAFGLSAALAAVAGILVAPVTLASPFIGLTLGLKAFAAAIIGGLTHPGGVLLGGLLLGVTEKLLSHFIPGFQDAAAFGLILLMLLVRPKGLIGGRTVEKY